MARGGLAAAATILAAGCGGGLCENTIVQEIRSLDGAKRAVIFHRSCGGTTGIGTHVSVAPARTPLGNDGGNVFTADGDHGAVREMTVGARWDSTGRLVITYPARARVFRQETRIDGVEVVYNSR